MNDDKNKKINVNGEKNIFITILKSLIVIVLAFIQIIELVIVYNTTKHIYNYATVIFWLLKLTVVLYILYKHSNPEYKVSWILFIAFLPVAGIVAYLLWGNGNLRKKKENNLNKLDEKTNKYLEYKNIEEEILSIDKSRYLQAKYLTNVTGYPCYKAEHIEYFDMGEKYFESLKEDLKNAKSYILIEYFLIAKGKLWNEISEILKGKSLQGVKINIIVDSFGCLKSKPKNFVYEMKKYGINVKFFNVITSFANGYVNYRDHRKIVVIDGTVAYTGGVNLADEYANIIERYGKWKDVGVKLVGKAAYSFSVMVLRSLQSSIKEKIDFNWYKNESDKNLKNINLSEKGYVIPFCDGPNNKKNPIENAYDQIINNAKDYVYITTPYLIIDEEILNAILISARSGVDVRIIVPHIPDKKLVNLVTKSFYQEILESGAKIYEYEPGFIHSKIIVSDNNVAMIGSANLDFRSFHVNFECAAWMYNTGTEITIKNDFDDTLKQCIQIDKEKWCKRSIIEKIVEIILSAFAPMM